MAAWVFKQCGSLHSKKSCHYFLSGNVSGLEVELWSAFRSGPGDYIFWFHLEHEPCTNQRRLRQLFEEYTPETWQGKCVSVHVDRIGSELAPTSIPEAVGRIDEVLQHDSSSDSDPIPSKKRNNQTHRRNQIQQPPLRSRPDLPPKAIICVTMELRGPKRNTISYDTKFHVLLATTAARLDEKIAEEITLWFQEEKSSVEWLDDRGYHATYSIQTCKSVFGQKTFMLRADHHDIDTIGDFFANPNIDGQALSLHVLIEAETGAIMRARKHVPLPRQETLTALYKERFLRPLSKSRDEFVYEMIYVRLGNVEKRRTSASSDHSPHESISSVTCLLGQHFVDYKKNPTLFPLISVTALDFGDYCIGDPKDYWNDQHFRKDFDYFEPYKGVKSSLELNRRIRNRLENNEMEPESGVPFQPTLTMNIYDAGRYGLGVWGYPSQGIDVAVVYRHHLNLSSADLHGQDELQLPWNQQWTMEPLDSAADVCEIVRDNLRNVATNSEDANSEILFQPPLAGTWDVQLWIMPQKLVRKLFQFPTGQSSAHSGLEQFLSKDKVALGDTRLYMEAHVVPCTA